MIYILEWRGFKRVHNSIWWVLTLCQALCGLYKVCHTVRYTERRSLCLCFSLSGVALRSASWKTVYASIISILCYMLKRAKK